MNVEERNALIDLMDRMQIFAFELMDISDGAARQYNNFIDDISKMVRAIPISAAPKRIASLPEKLTFINNEDLKTITAIDNVDMIDKKVWDARSALEKAALDLAELLAKAAQHHVDLEECNREKLRAKNGTA